MSDTTSCTITYSQQLAPQQPRPWTYYIVEDATDEVVSSGYLGFETLAAAVSYAEHRAKSLFGFTSITSNASLYI